jgi:hypothetical protein
MFAWNAEPTTEFIKKPGLYVIFLLKYNITFFIFKCNAQRALRETKQH